MKINTQKTTTIRRLLLDTVSIPYQSSQCIANIIIVVGSVVYVIQGGTHFVQQNYETFSESVIFFLPFYLG